MKPISLKLSDEEIKTLDIISKRANMNRSDYMRHRIFGDISDSIQIIDKSKEFYQSLQRIYDTISIIEKQDPKIDCNIIKKEISKAWQLLNI